MADETRIKRISSGLTAQFQADGDVSADSVEAYLNKQMAGLDSHSRITALQAVIDRLGYTCQPSLIGETEVR